MASTPATDPVVGLIASVKSLEIGRPSKASARKQTKTPPPKPWHRKDLKTGIIYDDFMNKTRCLWARCEECPRRYECVRDRFAHYNLIERCQRLDSRPATEDEVLLLHSRDYYELVKSTKGETDIERLKSLAERFDGVYFDEFTYDTAMLALGCSIKLTDAVLDGQLKNGFALIRTPGHHAQKTEANGFCFFNNAALVAQHAVKERGLKRVLIVDWDVHHGQGTQSFFYDNPNVLYVSIHRYENGKYWPELIESNFNFTGAGQGKGFNINLPLNEPGCNDADFLLMWFNVILPVAYEFNPELVIISAGFDAAIGCPEGHMRVKPPTYHVLCHSLMALADGKVVSLLEGGYNLLSLAESAVHNLRALVGDPCAKLDDSFIEFKPHQSIIRTMLSAIWALRPQWSLLRLQGSFNRFRADDKLPSTGGDDDNRPKFAPVAIYEGSGANCGETKPEKYDLNGVCCAMDEAEQAALAEEIKSIISRTQMTTSPKSTRTLLVFDDKMTAHKCPIGGHPEKPSRYTEIKKRLHDTGLYARCQIGQSRRATEDQLATVHSRAYIERLKRTPTMGQQELNKMADTLDSIYINPFTYDCALLAAGCAIEAVDRVMSGANCNAFALIRPPGHHAFHDEASGFCFFNNVVVAAKYALDNFASTCKRVLIVDYDFHHGNGVQRLVQGDDRFLYISLHGYDDGAQYPGEVISNFSTCSKNIINLPWNGDRMGDTEYIMAYLGVVLPAAYEFKPDLVLVSSGFDAAINDPLGRYRLSPGAYGHMVHHLLPLASGKLVACLEGGYNLESISEASANVVSILLGDPPQSLQLKAPSESAIVSIKNVISYHKSDYDLLCLDYDLPDDQVS